jgi:hypothetical protein
VAVTVELITPVLGMAPYVLVEITTVEVADPDDDGMRLNVRAGGGANQADTIVAILLAAVEGITGVPTDDYERQLAATPWPPP